MVVPVSANVYGWSGLRTRAGLCESDCMDRTLWCLWVGLYGPDCLMFVSRTVWTGLSDVCESGCMDRTVWCLWVGLYGPDCLMFAGNKARYLLFWSVRKGVGRGLCVDECCYLIGLWYSVSKIGLYLSIQESFISKFCQCQMPRSICMFLATCPNILIHNSSYRYVVQHTRFLSNNLFHPRTRTRTLKVTTLYFMHSICSKIIAWWWSTRPKHVAEKHSVVLITGLCCVRH
jgi:hypothetical protein